MKISFAATEKGERMMTCRDCIHYEVCKEAENLSETWLIATTPYDNMKKWCSHFENKADYAEVKHGEWVDKRWTTECDWCDMNHHSITCSVCKEETYGGIKTKYCPDCGAKMDGKKGE